MSYVEKLMNGEKVEWKAVEEIFDLKNGYTPSKNNKDYWTDGTIPWFRMEDIRKSGRILDKAQQTITDSALKGGKIFPANSIIMATSATIGEHALITVPFLCNQRFTCLSLKSQYQDKVDMKFAFYYCFNLAEWSKNNIMVGNFAGVDMNGFKKFQIPIPCANNPEKSRQIQQEIVRILDAFTLLTEELAAELAAELTARRRQYIYYRKKLLRFDKKQVEWKKLGEVINFMNAKPHEKLVVPDGDVALMTSKFISTEGRSARYVKSETVLSPALENDVAMVMSDLPNGRALAKTFFVDGNNRYAANQRVCLLRVKNPQEYLPRFLHFVVNRNEQLLAYDNGLDQTHLKKDWILNIRVPFPSLAEQVRIVSILERYDPLTTSISEGLSNEIEFRKKQYEYYRNLLLTFPKDDLTA